MTVRSVTGKTLIVVLLVAGLGATLIARNGTTTGTTPPKQDSCQLSTADLDAFERQAADTVSRLRDRVQKVTSVRSEHSLVVIRTEDTNRLAAHDGGKVSFDCRGHIELVWLDGG
jgi:hypothetical protein